MKMTAFLLVAFFVQVSARTSAQVTLKEKSASLEKVLAKIKKQSDYGVTYDMALVRLKGKPVFVDVSNVPVEKALEEVFKNQDLLSYSLNGKIISIKAKEEKKSQAGTSIPGINPGDIPPPPTKDISGKITDENGNPLVGAGIKVKGGTLGTTSNGEGIFFLKGVDEKAEIEISYVGYENIVLAVGIRTSFVVALKPSENTLQEVVINKGFYTEKERFSVSNVSQVRSKDIEKNPVTNPMLAIQGRVTGLEIKQLSGVAGGGVTLRIQGLNSIGSGLDPLIVIDGVSYPTIPSIKGAEPISGGSALNYVNPGDIESIDILKDADATALYGSRAGNGAILITTKKGKVGKTKFNFRVESGWDKMNRRVDMMDRRQYLDMRYEAYKNDGIDWRSSTVSANDLKVWDTTRNTNWQDELLGGKGSRTTIEGSISGGTSNLQYLVSGNYNRTTTVFSQAGMANTIGTLHFNLTGQSDNRKFKFTFSSNYSLNDNNLPGGNELVKRALVLEPVAPNIYNSDGSLNWAPNSAGNSTWENPMIFTLYNQYESKTANLFSNLKLGYSILPGVELTGLFGYTNFITDRFQPQYLYYFRPERRPTETRSSTFLNGSSYSYTVEPQLSYNYKGRNSKLSALVGFSTQRQRYFDESIGASGFTSDLLIRSPSSASALNVSTTETDYKYVGLFGQLGYTFQEKYIISLTARRDGSSRFGSANQYNNFGSIGLGWIFSEEGWFKRNLPFISFGKLHTNIGTTGNDNIPDYSYLALYAPSSFDIAYQDVRQFNPYRLANPFVQWEETRKFQVGIDFRFFKDRLNLKSSYSFNQSSNQLLDYSLPSTTGFNGVISNFPATIHNKTFELFIESVNIKQPDFKWTSAINFTSTRNKLAEFPDLAQSTYANRLVVGEPVSISKIFPFLNVDPATGKNILADRFGNPTVTINATLDRNISVAPSLPDFYAGLDNGFTYKQFQLDVFLYFVKQIGVEYTGENIVAGSFSGLSNSNKPVAMLDRWQQPGDQAKYQRYLSGSSTFAGAIDRRLTTVGYTDASFIRLKNVSLSWIAPASIINHLKLASIRLYLHAQNLATFTKFKGLDPEVQSGTSLPPLQSVTFGVQLGF